MPNSFLIRLYDNTSGYLSISNICDYIGYKKPNIYLLECKSHKGASIPFDALTQYDKMREYEDMDGVKAVFIVWLYEKDIVFAVPCKTLTQMKKDGEKSVGLRNIDNYDIIKIPSVKKRVFLESDYSVLEREV